MKLYFAFVFPLAIALSAGIIWMTFLGRDNFTAYLIAGGIICLIASSVCIDVHRLKSIIAVNAISLILLGGFLVYLSLKLVEILR